MHYRTFVKFNVIGGVIWSVGFVLLGYFLGSAFPALGENIDKAIIVILAFSVIPIAFEFWRHRRTDAPEAEDLDHDGRPDRDILGTDVDPRHG
jgi:membrane-associated protein